MDSENAELLQSNTAEVLTQARNVRIIKPNPPAIPISEGSHLQITTGVDASWRQRPVKELLGMAFFALPTAKILSEGRDSEDLWANVHQNSRPPFNTAINVFGRKPDSSTGWAKPVNLRDIAEGVVPAESKSKRSDEVLERYVGLWRNLLPQIELFSDGVGQIPADEVKIEENLKRGESTIWSNEKFSLEIIKKPHLSGLHLVVHPNKDYWDTKGGFKRAWQTDEVTKTGREIDQEHIQGFLEAFSIINGAQRLLLEGEEALSFYNPEVHFSGNWAKDLKPIEAGGKLDKSYLLDSNLMSARKAEKRAHRVGGENEWQTSMHGHLYATRDPNQFVTLPTRPESEVPNEWEGITPLSEDEELAIANRINQNLSSWLKNNAMGKLTETT